MNNTATIIAEPCQAFIEHKITVSVEESGHFLTVPVCLRDILVCQMLVVGVLVYDNNKLYSMQMKKIFTGRPECYHCDCCGRYHRHDRKDLFVGNFEFIISPSVNTRTLTTRIITHYIVEE